MGLRPYWGFRQEPSVGRELSRGRALLDLDQYASSTGYLSTDAYTTNTIDLDDPTARRQVGTGEPLSIVWKVDVAAVVSANTFDFLIVQSVNADLSAHTVLAQRRVLGASLTPFSRGNSWWPMTTPLQPSQVAILAT
jgi:hypothetical protein